jgi:hypothetical protein
MAWELVDSLQQGMKNGVTQRHQGAKRSVCRQAPVCSALAGNGGTKSGAVSKRELRTANCMTQARCARRKWSPAATAQNSKQQNS